MTSFPENWTVALVAPAGPCAPEIVERGAAALRDCGVRVKLFPERLEKRGGLPFLANSDAVRAEAFCDAVRDPEISAIWCVRGGYGCSRLLDKLDWELLRRRDLTVAGFSDVTALHWAMTAKKAGRVLAAPMMKFWGEGLDSGSRQSIFDALSGKTVTLTLPALRGGSADGPALPGNLTVAASLAGTPYFPDTAGRVLVLEDVGERPYRIDRALTQLLLAGAFARCAAVVFGAFTDCGEPAELDAVLHDFTARVVCPVFCGFPFGHAMPMHSLSDRQRLLVSRC